MLQQTKFEYSKKVLNIKLEIGNCVGYVSPLMMDHPHLNIGMDFLINKWIVFYHGKVFLMDNAV